MKIYSFVSALPVTMVALFAGSVSVATVALASPATDVLSADLLQTHNEIAKTGNHIQDAVRSLAALTGGETTDLKKGFEAYSQSILDTEADATRTRERAKTMRDNMTTYFAKWSVEVESMSPDLKASSQERLNSVQKRYSQIEKDLFKAAEKFRPLVNDLADIQGSLKNSLTSSSVYAIRDKSDSVQQEMLSLHGDLKLLLTQIIDTRLMLGAMDGSTATVVAVVHASVDPPFSGIGASSGITEHAARHKAGDGLLFPGSLRARLKLAAPL